MDSLRQTIEREAKYAERYAECCVLAKKITEALGEGGPPIEAPNWGNVVAMIRARDLLEEAAQNLGIKDVHPASPGGGH